MSKQAILNKVNKKLIALIQNKYFDSIPLKEIAAILNEFGIKTDQLDGLYCGREGRVNIRLEENNDDYFHLVLTWYKMGSGRFEVVTYLN